MKQVWTEAKLSEYWTLHDEVFTLFKGKTGQGRLALAVLLRHYQLYARVGFSKQRYITHHRNGPLSPLLGMRPSQLPDTIRRKIPIEGRPADSEPINHITIGRVVFRILQHGFGLAKTFLIHALRPPTSPPAFVSGGEPGSGVLHDQLAYKISDNQAADQLQKARQKLFKTIHGRALKTG